MRSVLRGESFARSTLKPSVIAKREKGISECGKHQLGVYRGFLRSVLSKEPESDAVEEIRSISKGSDVSEYLIKLPPDAPL